MSLRLAHALGWPDQAEVDLFDQCAILSPFGPKGAERWAGARRPYRQVVSFAIKLPRQAAECWALMEMLVKVGRYCAGRPIHKLADTLLSKLILSLGLPAAKDDMEPGFYGAAAANPGDLSTWMAWADWLSEQEGAAGQRRGLVMAGWLGPKAVKVKYGMPISAMNHQGGEP